MIIVKNNTKIKKTEIAAIERHPVPVLGVDYRVKIIYKNIKIAELDVENTTIKISLPNKYKKCDNKKILDMAIDKMYEQIAKVEIENAMEKIRVMLEIAPEKCENNKITISPEVIKYNRKFIEYVVLHEYCHLKYKNHCRSFFEMISKYEPEYEKYEEIYSNNK